MLFHQRLTEPVRNSWTHLLITWDSTGKLNVYVDGHVGFQDPRYVKCGSITTPLPAERMYGLGRGSFPVAYFDNLAIWYQNKSGFTEPWKYLTSKSGLCWSRLVMTPFSLIWLPVDFSDSYFIKMLKLTRKRKKIATGSFNRVSLL